MMDRKRKSVFVLVLRKVCFRILALAYIIAVLGFGYWYWSRPVRSYQYQSAHEKWVEILQTYHIPIPHDERWGS